MWDMELSVVGRCPECGDDLSDTIRLRAPAVWLARYAAEDSLRRGIDRSIERLVRQRHERGCAGKQRQRQMYALPA
ncbi:MAG: hypothetical protein ACHQ4H_18770 [Ktedonobacterales bacterium]